MGGRVSGLLPNVVRPGARRVALVLAACVVAGVMMAVFPAMALVGLCGLALALLTAVQPGSVLLLSVSSVALFNIAVIRLPFADLRPFQFVWTLVIVVALARLALGRDTWRPAAVWAPLSLFTSAQFLSIATSQSPVISLVDAIQTAYLAAVFVVIYECVRTPRQVLLSVVILLSTSVVFGLSGLATSLIGESPIPLMEIDVGSNSAVHFVAHGLKEQVTVEGALLRRTSALFMGPVATANLAGQFLILALALLWGGRLSSAWRLVLWGIGALGFVVLVLTYSRAAWVIFAVCLLFLGFLQGRVRLSAAAVAMMLAAGCLAERWLGFASVIQRLSEAANPLEGSIRGHLALYAVAAQMFRTSPATGIGAGVFRFGVASFPEVFRQFDYAALSYGGAHNMLLGTAAESGVAGAAGLIWLLAACFARFWRGIRHTRSGLLRDVRVGLAMAVLMAVLMNQTMNAFQTETFWVMLGLGYAASSTVDERRRAPSPGWPENVAQED